MRLANPRSQFLFLVATTVSAAYALHLPEHNVPRQNPSQQTLGEQLMLQVMLDCVFWTTLKS